MIRFLLYLAIAIGIVYFATTVQLGKHTLVGHIRAIWHTSEVQDLKEGVKDKAAPAVNRLERGAKAGLHAVTRGSDAGSQATTAEARP
jgi:hypothetical protein